MNKLEDCRAHGAGAELFIVEGDSAASAVAALRNPHNQAVLPMQGKPLNAWRASRDRVQANILYSRLCDALQIPLTSSTEAAAFILPKSLRFEQVFLLFDPDADGIHIGALMLMFFAKWMRPLLERGSIAMIRPPLYRLRWKEKRANGIIAHEGFAYSYAQCQAMFKSLPRLDEAQIDLQHFRGLANLDRALLHQHCINPASRTAQTMSMVDALAAIQAFGHPHKSRNGPSEIIS